MTEMSANEVEALVLKAARGGGLPLGAAEDLARTVRFLDMDRMAGCPCRGDRPAAVAVPVALDLVWAGNGPQEVAGDAAVIEAFVAAYEKAVGAVLSWRKTKEGAVFVSFNADRPAQDVRHFGRRVLAPDLLEHLSHMAAKTLAPETEASRAAGAGAGLTDND